MYCHPCTATRQSNICKSLSLLPCQFPYYNIKLDIEYFLNKENELHVLPSAFTYIVQILSSYKNVGEDGCIWKDQKRNTRKLHF